MCNAVATLLRVGLLVAFDAFLHATSLPFFSPASELDWFNPFILSMIAVMTFVVTEFPRHLYLCESDTGPSTPSFVQPSG
jgi:hypothetical protein